MEKLDLDTLKQINGGKTENQDEFYQLGKNWGRATREALGTIGIFFLFLR